MQVSQIAELDTHVVIGGQKAKAFFMSDSAEFFTILSDTLYRDKKLAVAREVICNAWDAHIMVGKTDLPIEITLTDDELMIKDFGPGIADAKMHDTYCGYGVSTKVKDDKATGGFGLGCKSPFAYSDHFTVTSCHDSWRCVYAISRGGVETEGKPGLIRMVRVKTEEAGLAVQIPLKEKADRYEFERLIMRVVKQGGIKAKLNGNELPSWDVSAVDKAGYALIADAQLHESSVYVRYGAVMYPVSTTDSELSRLIGLFANDSYTLILSAPAGAIGITPSREALSYSEKTIAWLREALLRVAKVVKDQTPIALRTMAERRIAAQKNKVVPADFNRYGYIDNEQPVLFTADPLQITINLVQASIAAESNRQASLGEFRPRQETRRKALFKAAMRKHRDHRRSLRRMMNAKDDRNRFQCGSGYAPDTMRVLIRMGAQLGILKQISRYGERVIEDDYREYTRTGMHPLAKVKGPFPDKPTLLLVRGREQASGYCSGRYNQEEVMRNIAFITVRTLKADKIEEIRAAAKRYKFELKELDIAPPVREKKPKAEKAEEPKQEFWSLADVDKVNWGREKARLIEHAPVFINMETTVLGGSDSNGYKFAVREIIKHSKDILAVYPQVALAHGQREAKALIAAGSVSLADALARDFLALKNTPETLFAMITGRGHLSQNEYGYSASALACTLAKSDLRFAKLLTGRRVVAPAAELHVHALIKLYNSVPMTDPDRKIHKHVDKLFDEAVKQQSKKSDFEYLAPLADCWGHRGNRDEIQFTEAMAEMIRFLQRQKGKSAVNNKPQPLKEAA